MAHCSPEEKKFENNLDFSKIVRIFANEIKGRKKLVILVPSMND